MQPRQRAVAMGVCVGFSTLLLTYALILPPYEGFDEPAHYSYISTLADAGQIPDFRNTPLDATVKSDIEGLPHYYAHIPPFDDNGGLTYASFFTRVASEQRGEAVARLWTRPDEPVQYKAGSGNNWIGQHPPLYYALMSVPYRAARGLSPGGRLLLLRLVSVAIACGGLLFWYMSVGQMESQRARWAILVAGVAVLFFPSCWYDLARLGNDSLTATLTTAAFYFTLRTFRGRQQNLLEFVGLAVVLGCGLLTKAFFVPLSAGIVAYLTLLAIVRRDISPQQWLVRMAILVALSALIAGWWFWLYHQRYGSPLGSMETYYWNRESGPALGDAMSLGQYARHMCRAMAAFVITFLWSGSWSWVHRPLWHYVMMAPLMLLVCWKLLPSAGLLNRGGTEPSRLDNDTRWLLLAALLMLAPMMAGFVQYMNLRVHHTGFGSGAGGYYLFVAWLPVGLLLGRVLEVPNARSYKFLLLLSLGLAILFEVWGLWFSAQIYAGLVEKIGSVKTGVGQLWPTPSNLALVIGRLGQIAMPRCAFALWIVSLAVRVALVGLILTDSETSNN